MKQNQILYLFTRTPLHVGAGSSVGAIDLPIQRERHTGLPIIPASALKGSFSDAWNERTPVADASKESGGERIRRSSTGAWLFGSESDSNASAGSVLFTEARLLAFPIRSAKGSFAWITSPYILSRAARDGVIDTALAQVGSELADDEALFQKGGSLDVGDGQVVLEEYCFEHKAELPASEKEGLGDALKELFDDPLWQAIAGRLVVLSNGMMTYFAKNGCEVAQHVRIRDETGTADGGALFNQENVPSDTLLYSTLCFLEGRGENHRGRTPQDAIDEFAGKLKSANQVFQFGGNASTGLGFCTVKLNQA